MKKGVLIVLLLFFIISLTLINAEEFVKVPIQLVNCQTTGTAICNLLSCDLGISGTFNCGVKMIDKKTDPNLNFYLTDLNLPACYGYINVEGHYKASASYGSTSVNSMGCDKDIYSSRMPGLVFGSIKTGILSSPFTGTSSGVCGGVHPNSRAFISNTVCMDSSCVPGEITCQLFPRPPITGYFKEYQDLASSVTKIECGGVIDLSSRTSPLINVPSKFFIIDENNVQVSNSIKSGTCSRIDNDMTCKAIFSVNDLNSNRGRNLRCKGLVDADKSNDHNIVTDNSEGSRGQIFIVELGNLKNKKFYNNNIQKKPVFIVSDDEWENVLPSVSVSIWQKAEGKEEWCNIVDFSDIGATRKCSYPLLIYHKEDTDVDTESVSLFLERYNPDKVFFTETPVSGIEKIPGMTVHETKTNILDFWLSYNVVVWVENRYKMALLASQLAGQLNAPLIIQGTPIDNPNSYKNTTVICITESMECPLTPGDFKVESIVGLRSLQARIKQEILNNGGLNNKVIIVNQDDINSFCRRETVFEELYCKMSLSAPVLALGKDEIITPIELDAASIKNTDTVKDRIWEIFARLLMPDYVTFLVAPTALPQNIKSSNSLIYLSLDRIYLDNNNDGVEDIPFGRIYTRNSAGVSSYIARILFKLEFAQNDYLSVADDYNEEQGYHTGLQIVESTLLNVNAVCKSKFNPFGVCQDNDDQPGDIANKKIFFGVGRGIGYNVFGLKSIDASIGLDYTCSANFYGSEGISHPVGAEIIAKGGLGYIGAVGSVMTSADGISKVSDFGEYIFRNIVSDNPASDLGNVVRNVYKGTKEFGAKLKSSDFILIGDPTFTPNIPRFSSPFIISYTGVPRYNEKIEAHPFIAGKRYTISFDATELNYKPTNPPINYRVSTIDAQGNAMSIPTELINIGANSVTSQFDFTPENSESYMMEIRAYNNDNGYFGSTFISWKKSNSDNPNLKLIFDGFHCWFKEQLIGTTFRCSTYVHLNREDSIDSENIVFEVTNGKQINLRKKCEEVPSPFQSKLYLCGVNFETMEIGKYNLKLTIKSNSGASDSAEDTVKSLPIEINLNCPESISRTDTSFRCKGTIYSWKDEFDSNKADSMIFWYPGDRGIIISPLILPENPVPCNVGRNIIYKDIEQRTCDYHFVNMPIEDYNGQIVVHAEAFAKSIDEETGKNFNNKKSKIIYIN
jgi:hypothetical protein